MKIVLSRKGFDNSNGGCASPILPDGTLLSLPIPCDSDNDSYAQLESNKINYKELLKDLNPSASYNKCHLDPDIRPNTRNNMPQDWKPAFGQTGSAQGLLRNAGVSVGDIFLFFGWFRKVTDISGRYEYLDKKSGDFYDHSNLQVVYGYMQVGKILTTPEEISEYYWHPHANKEVYKSKNNALYIPTEKLSLIPSLKGYGTLSYNKKRVLTKKDCTRAVWNEYDFLLPEHIYGKKKNSSKKGLYYAGIWQELVIKEESPELIDWVKQIIC